MLIAIHQPQYMPWLGYFDKIAQADLFVILDTVQFKKNEWQNRNRIKTAQGWQWLTVPVTYRFPERIREVGVNNQISWQAQHRKSLQANYGRAPHFVACREFLDEVFSRRWETIAALNTFVVKELCRILGIITPIHVASELPVFSDDADERIIAIARYFGCDEYLAGSGGKAYMDLAKYEDAGISVRYQDYHCPEYPQLFGAFVPNLSVLDLLFNCGERSLSVLRGTA